MKHKRFDRVEFQHIDPDCIEYLARCQCNAITVTIDGEDYSMKPMTFTKIFGIRACHYRGNSKPDKYCNCNHCVNNWGVDLCACGSGEPFYSCDGDYKECGQPMQVIDEYTDVRAEDAWGFPHKMSRQL